jgi:hypothetical protein
MVSPWGRTKKPRMLRVLVLQVLVYEDGVAE